MKVCLSAEIDEGDEGRLRKSRSSTPNKLPHKNELKM